MLNKTNPLDPRYKAQALLARCQQEGDMDACYELSYSKMSSEIAKMSEGGMMSSLLAMEEPMEDMEMEEEASGLESLRDVVGEEAFSQLEEAMEYFPVVRQVAEMAMHTSDGEVDGLGGPKDDKVPARLSPGEFVFSAEAVQALGLDKLEELHEYGKQLAASS
jgi:hypothetical protein